MNLRNGGATTGAVAWWRDEGWPASLVPLVVLTQLFVDGELGADEFELPLVNLFQAGRGRMDGFDPVLNSFFLDVDGYVAEPGLRYSADDLDGEQLRACAEVTLNRLRRIKAGYPEPEEELQVSAAARQLREGALRPEVFKEAFGAQELWAQRPAEPGFLVAEVPGMGRWIRVYSDPEKLADAVGECDYMMMFGSDLVESMPAGVGAVLDPQHDHAVALPPQELAQWRESQDTDETFVRPWLEARYPRAGLDYLVLVNAFVDRRLSAAEFALLYSTVYHGGVVSPAGAVGEVYDALAGEVDRFEPGDESADDEALRDRARQALRRLRKIGPEPDGYDEPARCPSPSHH